MNKRILLSLLCLLLITAAVTLRITRYYTIACDDFANNGVKGNLTKIINEKIANNQYFCNIQYDQIVNISYFSNGQISSIKVNTEILNKVTLELSNTIYNSILESENDFQLPLGNAFGIRYLSGKGPKINVTVLPLGAVTHKIGSELITSGINQTLHRISVKYTTEVSCIAPFHESKFEIETTVIIAEILIVGEVPQIILPSV